MKDYLNNTDPEWFRSRLAKLAFCIIGAFLLLGSRLFYLQIIQGQELRRLSENNCIRLRRIDPPRGLLLDSQGHIMVDNRPSFDLNIVPKDAEPLQATLQKVAPHLDLSVSALEVKIEQSRSKAAYRPIVLKRDIGRDALAAIEVRRFDIPGVVVDVRPTRHYIEAQSACHLIGYLGEINALELDSDEYRGCRVGDHVGKFGAEKTFEPFLRGRRGGQQVEVDATGQVVRVLKTVDAQAGHNIFLSISRSLQQRAENLLSQKVGAVVAVEPDTGRILAMASSPAFNPNLFVSGLSHEHWNALVHNPHRPMENKAVQAEYPPGSTYKIITAIAGLEEGVIDEHTTFFCPGHYPFGDRVFFCWRVWGHGDVNVVTALEESCDVFFYQVGQKLGIDRLAWYAKACGLGTPTGIRLNDEGSGLVPTAAWKKRRTGISWQKGETLSVAIGQGFNLTTPLQMAMLVAAVANGGTRYQPLIMDKIVASDGHLVQRNRPRVTGKIPCSDQTLNVVRRGLWNAVNGRRGTARQIRLADIGICGKTGTAQIYSRRTDTRLKEEELADHLKSHAWFLAYAPESSPQIAVAVIVEHGAHGSSAAAPIAQELIKTYLRPEKPSSAPAKEPGSTPVGDMSPHRQS